MKDFIKSNGDPLLTKNNQPNPKYFNIFIFSDDPVKKREIFGLIRSCDSDIRGTYYKLALEMIYDANTSNEEKIKILNSFIEFYDYSEEGLFLYAPPSLSIRDSGYYNLLDTLETYLSKEDIPKNVSRVVFDCLIKMNYLREKKTLMLSYVKFYYPYDINWFIRRLKFMIISLNKNDEYIAWHILSFLFELSKKDYINKMITDKAFSKKDKKQCKELLAELDSIVPKFLLANDYKVVGFACLYCNIRELIDTLPILEMIKDTDNKLIKETVKGTIKKFEKIKK